MIYTDMNNLEHYRGMAPHLDTAIDFLKSHALTELKAGRNDVDGENVFINRFGYETMAEEAAAFEAMNFMRIFIWYYLDRSGLA